MLDPIAQRLVVGFFPEAQELCASVAQDLVTVEDAREPAEVARVYAEMARHLHTLKGSSAVLGLEDVAALAKRLEDLVAPLRSALAPIPAFVSEAILRVLEVALARTRLHAEGKGEALPWPASEIAAVEHVHRFVCDHLR